MRARIRNTRPMIPSCCETLKRAVRDASTGPQDHATTGLQDHQTARDEPGSPVVPSSCSPVVPPMVSWSRGPVVLACAFALLGVGQLCRGWQHGHAPGNLELVNRFALRQGATFVMPDQIGEWRRVERETPTLQKIETQGV